MGKKSNLNIQKEDILLKDEIEFEDVLDQAGQMGRFQYLVWFICGLAEMQTGSATMYFVFSNFVPSWNCSRYENNVSFYGEGECDVNGSKCLEYDIDGSVFRSIIGDWGLICDQSYIPNILTSIQMAGTLVGGAVFGQLGDLIGRKKTYLICIAGVSISSVLTGLSPNWYAFAVFRCFCGAFIGGNYGNGWMYASEFVGVNYRPFVFLTGWYNIGTLWLNLFAYWLGSWDYLAYVVGAAGVFLIPAAGLFVPESPRWLIQRKNFKQAAKVMNHISRMNKNGELNHLKESLPRILRNEEKSREKAGRYTYLDLFRTKDISLKTASVCTIWFTLSYIYYVISVQISSFPGNIYFKMLIQPVATAVFLWSSIPIVMRMSRKKVYIGLGVVASLLLILLVVLRMTGAMSSTSTGFTVLAIGGQIVASTQWCSTGGTTVEIFPTLIRVMGFGAASVAARIAGILAPQIDTLGTIAHWSIPYILAIVCMITSCVLLQVLLPETAGKPISENMAAGKKAEPSEGAVKMSEISEPLNV